MMSLDVPKEILAVNPVHGIRFHLDTPYSVLLEAEFQGSYEMEFVVYQLYCKDGNWNICEWRRVSPAFRNAHDPHFLTIRCLVRHLSGGNEGPPIDGSDFLVIAKYKQSPESQFEQGTLTQSASNEYSVDFGGGNSARLRISPGIGIATISDEEPQDQGSPAFDIIVSDSGFSDIKIVSGEHTIIDGYEPIFLNLNHSAGGDHLFVHGRRAKSGEPPITDVVILNGEAAVPPPQYSKINVDLNHGAGGDWLFLCFSCSPNSGFGPIKGLGVMLDGRTLDTSLPSRFQDWEKKYPELNKGCGAATDNIYLITRR